MSLQPFKHMSAVEGLVWDAFLRRHGREYDSFSYDERVGLPHTMSPGLAPYIQTMIQKVSTHRIDVVGYKGSAPTLFEVKDRAARGAIGALALYGWLWAIDHPEGPPPAFGIVAASVHPEVEQYLRAHGIALYLFPAAHSPSGAIPAPR